MSWWQSSALAAADTPINCQIASVIKMIGKCILLASVSACCKQFLFRNVIWVTKPMTGDHDVRSAYLTPSCFDFKCLYFIRIPEACIDFKCLFLFRCWNVSDEVDDSRPWCEVCTQAALTPWPGLVSSLVSELSLVHRGGTQVITRRVIVTANVTTGNFIRGYCG